MDDDDSHSPDGLSAEVIEEPDEEFTLAEWEDLQDRAAEEIAAEAIADPRLALIGEAGQRAGFEARLEARWGRGLDLADLVVHNAFECGSWVNDLLWTEPYQDHKFEALIRLHGKAVLTAREVMVLLRRGYSSGALARWRTLHEVWVVFELLADGDDELSRRYLAHDDVESLKGQKDYEDTWEALRFDPPDWDPAERKEAQRELANEFGKDFLNGYGWAANLLDKPSPTLRNLRERAGLDHWRGFYRLASHGTHANSKGTTWNIQGYEPYDIIWASPSNSGLVDPAQCSLIALAGVNASLLAYMVRELPDSEDHLLHLHTAAVRQKVILILKDHAIGAFVEVDAQLEAEEEAMTDLIGQAAEFLLQGTPMTAEGLAAALQVDADDLADALGAAVERGLMLQETHYRVGDDGSEPSHSKPPGGQV